MIPRILPPSLPPSQPPLLTHHRPRIALSFAASRGLTTVFTSDVLSRTWIFAIVVHINPGAGVEGFLGVGNVT